MDACREHATVLFIFRTIHVSDICKLHLDDSFITLGEYVTLNNDKEEENYVRYKTTRLLKYP